MKENAVKKLPINQKELILFLSLVFSLFFVTQKIDALFFDPAPITKNYGNVGDHPYATQWNPSGTYLAVGGVNYPTDVTIYQWDGVYLDPTYTLNFGSGAYAVSWSPNGQYVAVGGDYGQNPLGVYKWDGTTLTLTASKYHGTQVNALAWSPNGNTLAVGGVWGYNDLAVYSWDGSGTLTLTVSKSHGTQVNAVAWHPAGTKLAVGGANGTQDLILYNWNGSALTQATAKDHGTQANALAWSHSGIYLAVGGDNGSDDVIIYSLSGSTLTQVATLAFGTQAKTLAWSFDDKYLTVGGDNGSTDLIVYEWNGATLTPITNSQTSYGNGVYAADWSPYADYLAVAGDNGLNDLTLYANHGYLNGTKNNIKISDHYLFSHGGYVLDNVNITNGCTVLPAQTLKVALLAPLSGGLDLRNTGIVQLEDDLCLDASVTLSAGGYIYGQGHVIYLGNNLTIPDNSVMYITSNTIIDGGGHKLNLGHESQLFIDWGVTLTLKNLTLKNSVNNQSTPPVRLNGKASMLALDNVELALSSDFSFTYGQLFIHNDVMVTGTSKFNYMSSRQSYIDSSSTLCFDVGTTFSFAPYFSPSMTINTDGSNSRDLFFMKDASAALFLNGATLAITHTGLRLTRGKLLLDNGVTLTSQYYEGKHKQAPTSSLVFGRSALGNTYNVSVEVLGGAHINQYCPVRIDEA